MFDAWLGTKRAGIIAALVVVWFAALNGMVLLGYGAAVALLAVSGGVLAGHLAGFLISGLIGRVFVRRPGVRRWGVALILGSAITVSLAYLGFYITDSPALLSEKGELPGVIVFGSAIGTAGALRRRLGTSARTTPEEDHEAREAKTRSVLVVGVAVAGLFALAFSTHVLIEYVLGPVIRTLAP